MTHYQEFNRNQQSSNHAERRIGNRTIDTTSLGEKFSTIARYAQKISDFFIGFGRQKPIDLLSNQSAIAAMKPNPNLSTTLELDDSYFSPPVIEKPLERTISTTYERDMRSIAVERMNGSFNNVEKREERRRFLDQNPDKKIRLDEKKLKEIIDYLQIKCHVLSSLALDLAIEGSDIDVGVVFLKHAEPLEDIIHFVQALRSQGFAVCHESEVKTGITGECSALVREHLSHESSRYLNSIRFLTPEEVQKMLESPLEDIVNMVVFAGSEISKNKGASEC